MKLLVVSEYTRPWPGGISEHVHHEAEELRSRGHDVTVLSGPSQAHDGLWRLPHAVEFVDNGARSRASFGAELFSLRRAMQRRAFDVVHVHAPLDPLLGLAAVLAAPCPVVGTFHASLSSSPLWRLRYRATPMTARAFRKLAACIAVSREAERALAGIFPSTCRVIPNGVDTARFSPEITERSGPQTVLFVGRPDPRKGLDVLLAAFTRLRTRVPGVRLRLGGVSRDALGSVREMSGVEPLGYVAPEDMPSLFASADVVCAPSLGSESQGIVLLEAMASGKATVCFDIPGYREVVTHDVDAYVARAQTPEALEESVFTVLRDEALRKRLGVSARKRAEDFEWGRVASRLETVFDEVRSGGNGPAKRAFSRDDV